MAAETKSTKTLRFGFGCAWEVLRFFRSHLNVKLVSSAEDYFADSPSVCAEHPIDDNFDEFDFFWYSRWSPFSWARSLEPHQRIDTFTDLTAVTYKHVLAFNLRILQALFPAYFTFAPDAWLLPAEFDEFSQVLSESKDDIFIAKIGMSSRGRRIFLFRDLSGFDGNYSFNLSAELKRSCFKLFSPQIRSNGLLCDTQRSFRDGAVFVVQRYIADPFLVFGLKFDLRVYLLVTSLWPLTVFAYSEGIVRFACNEYDNANLSKFAHLTNTEIGKLQMPAGKSALNREQHWLMSELFDHLNQFTAISNCAATVRVKVKRMLALVSMCLVDSHLKPDPHAFQLLGADILLDSQLNPHLIEINAYPSMEMSFPKQKVVKTALLTDLCMLLQLSDPPAVSDSFGCLSWSEAAEQQWQMGSFELISPPANKTNRFSQILAMDFNEANLSEFREEFVASV